MELTAVFIVVGKCEGKPDATFSFADDDFMAVSSGSINPQMAFVRYVEGTSVVH
jgi:putative sterol carrier protein